VLIIVNKSLNISQGGETLKQTRSVSRQLGPLGCLCERLLQIVGNHQYSKFIHWQVDITVGDKLVDNRDSDKSLTPAHTHTHTHTHCVTLASVSTELDCRLALISIACMVI